MNSERSLWLLHGDGSTETRLGQKPWGKGLGLESLVGIREVGI